MTQQLNKKRGKLSRLNIHFWFTRYNQLFKSYHELQQTNADLQRKVTDYEFGGRVSEETYAHLEQRIAERTAELQRANNLLQEQILERQRAEMAEREQRILAQALSDTASAINSTLNLHEILERILVNLERILPSDTASVMMIESGIARIVHQRGFEQRGMNLNWIMNFQLAIEEHGNLKEMYDTGRPITISDTRNHPAWKESDDSLWIQSYVGAPIRVEGHVIGFVNLDSALLGRFDESDGEKLLAFANQAGIAIQNADLFEAIHGHASKLEQSVAARTSELQREHAQLQAIMNSMNEGLVGQIYDNDGKFYINDALLQMTGYKADEWDFHRLKSSSMSEDTYRETITAMQAAVLEQGIWQGEMRLSRKDGSEFEAHLTASRVDDQNGLPIGRVIIIRDIMREKVLQEQKSRFVANASHELRTPLTNLITRLYLVRKQPERLIEHLDILDRAASRMRNLVEDLLDYSRFERGIIPLKPRQLDLRDLIKDVTWVQTAEAEQKGLHLEADLTDKSVTVEADPERVTQVITNLVTNAIHYTPEGGNIYISLSQEQAEDNAYAVIRVSDTGMGIPEELKPNIFLPFQRGSENNKGTGLGLAIAKEIVERHAGTIHVESSANQGSTFIIRLPLANPTH